MSFDRDPADVYEHYQCECGGSIRLNEGKTLWECDTCDWNRAVISKNNTKECNSNVGRL